MQRSPGPFRSWALRPKSPSRRVSLRRIAPRRSHSHGPCFPFMYGACSKAARMAHPPSRPVPSAAETAYTRSAATTTTTRPSCIRPWNADPRARLAEPTDNYCLGLHQGISLHSSGDTARNWAHGRSTRTAQYIPDQLSKQDTQRIANHGAATRPCQSAASLLASPLASSLASSHIRARLC